eukprot:5056600-Pleurochrysis_carterae.AAC.2
MSVRLPLACRSTHHWTSLSLRSSICILPAKTWMGRGARPRVAADRAWMTPAREAPLAKGSWRRREHNFGMDAPPVAKG